MILAIALLLLGIGIGIYYSIRNEGEWYLTVLGLVGGLTAVLIICCLVGMAAPVKNVPSQPIYLYSLRNNSEVNGSFFLGTGFIDETQTAFYSTIESDGAIVFRHIPLESTKVYQDNPEKPYLLYYSSEFKYDWLKYLFLLPNDTNIQPAEFHIPEGSVFQGYTLK
jgi:hypothetical protein